MRASITSIFILVFLHFSETYLRLLHTCKVGFTSVQKDFIESDPVSLHLAFQYSFFVQRFKDKTRFWLQLNKTGLLNFQQKVILWRLKIAMKKIFSELII